MLRQGDRDADRKLDRPEVDGVAEPWFRTLDKRNSGRLTQADFPFHLLAGMQYALGHLRAADTPVER